MWCFIDESWSPDEYRPRFGVLLGVLILNEQLSRLDDFLFATRKKYFGLKHAKDRELDLKGKELLSNGVLKRWKKTGQIPKNVCVVKEVLGLPIKAPEFYVRVFGSTVFSPDDRLPSLVSPDVRQLAAPFRSLIQNVAAAAREYSPERSVNIVFDQRLDAQSKIAIAVTNFIAGTQLTNVRRYPYFAVSNVSPGVQVADIFAHLLAKRAQGHKRVMGLYNDLKRLQWESTDPQSNPKRYGLVRFNETIGGDGRVSYRKRSTW